MHPPRSEWATSWLSTPKTSHVGGEWLPGDPSRRTSVENPATREPLGAFFEASSDDVSRAVSAARRAFLAPAWRDVPRRARAAMLRAVAAVIREHRAELATLESLANGKLYREAYEDDIPEAADVLDYYAGWTDKFYGETCPADPGFLNYTVREPIGVCALLVPWNFPLLLAAWKLGPALAMGNTVILKPSPYTPFSAVRLVELVAERGLLPPGVLNLVLGDAVPGEALGRHPGVDKLSFTGSTAVGKRLVRQAGESNLKAITLELGGKSPNIIFADAPDLGFAVERSFTAMFSHKGEKCSEPTRLLVERPRYAEVVDRLAALAEKVVCGDPFDPGSDQGPQCHRAHFDRVMGYLEIGRAEGARVAAGGHADTRGANARGYFVRPTVLADVTPSMRVAREEIFGPVLVVLPFHSEEEAIGIANDTEYGLAAGLWTSDLSRAQRVTRALDAGMVFVNRYGCYDFASPFGGFKASGWGKEMGPHGLEAYSRLKAVWMKA